jgi:hypothetical protein
MTRVLITAQMSLKPYLEAGRLNQQELVASSVSTGGKHTQEMLSGEIACLDLGLHCAYVGGHGWRLTGLPPEGARDATTQSWYSRTERDDAFAGNVVWRGLNTYAEAVVCNRLEQPLPTTESGDGSTLTRTCVRATSGRLLRCMHMSRSSSRAVGSSLKHRSPLTSCRDPESQFFLTWSAPPTHGRCRRS